jgi:hypothetical protein
MTVRAAWRPDASALGPYRPAERLTIPVRYAVPHPIEITRKTQALLASTSTAEWPQGIFQSPNEETYPAA